MLYGGSILFNFNYLSSNSRCLNQIYYFEIFFVFVTVIITAAPAASLYNYLLSNYNCYRQFWVRGQRLWESYDLKQCYIFF